MLKKILTAKEKTALVKTELESFFLNQVKYFENHMKTKHDMKTESFDSFSKIINNEIIPNINNKQ